MKRSQQWGFLGHVSQPLGESGFPIPLLSWEVRQQLGFVGHGSLFSRDGSVFILLRSVGPNAGV